jgi:hypothetical protein
VSIANPASVKLFSKSFIVKTLTNGKSPKAFTNGGNQLEPRHRIPQADGTGDENAAGLEQVIDLGDRRFFIGEQVQHIQAQHRIVSAVRDAQFDQCWPAQR